MSGSTNSITEGLIWKHILIFFFPILLGTFFQQLYNTVDAIIVGRFMGKTALAAVGGSTSTIINLLVGFFVGVSSGASIIIAQAYGARQRRAVHRAVHTAIALALAAGAIIMIVGLVFSSAMLRAMHVPDEILEQALIYMRIFFVGMIPALLYNMGAGILRAAGDSRRPFYFLIAGCLTNIVLDLLFIAVFGMGVAGAALATILSQLVSALLVLRCMSRSDDSYKLNYKIIHFAPLMLKNMIRIGLPAGFQSIMYSFSNVIIQTSVNQFGTDTIAAYTAYGKIDSVFWMMISAFGIAVTTFSGQNFGAGRLDRVRKSLRQGLLLAGTATIALSIILWFAGPAIYLLFTNDPDVIAIGVKILHFLCPVFICYVCIELFSAVLRGTGDVFIPTIIVMTGVCLLRIIWISLAVPLKRDLITVMTSYPVTWTLTSSLFIIYYLNWSKISRLKREEKNEALSDRA